jgi:hypothetical protein
MNLKEIEARLQALIEVDLLNVLPSRKVDDVIVQKLAAAIHLNSRSLEDSTVAAPNVFTLVMNPETSVRWQDQQLLSILMHSIVTVAQEAGIKFVIAPTITISTDEKISINDAEVVASHRVEVMAETNATPLDSDNLAAHSSLPENAFLIVEGVKIFPLTLAVVNIGRRLDNQLIIDDPRVSRNHAQLRAIKGRFVVFDLSSTGGTFVNGQRANQSVLYPGDVISLAGVALIFGQDNPPPHPELKDTAPLKSAVADHATVSFKERATAKIKKK